MQSILMHRCDSANGLNPESEIWNIANNDHHQWDARSSEGVPKAE